MRISAEYRPGSLTKMLDVIEGEIADDVTQIMREETRDLTMDYRQQVRDAGMGNRLANTWRAEVYPKGGRSLNPAGYIWSNAPAIIDAFARGAHIRPVNGAKWLWIPTRNVPARRRGGTYASSVKRSNGTRMSPEEVEMHFNAELQVVIEGSKGSAFIDVVSGLSGGYRRATPGRTQGRRGMAPRKQKAVLMFNLVRGVRMPRLFDLDGPAQKRAANVARRIAAKWG
ncbi:hypothetical protein KRZ98_09995 [Sphingobium sp. AS12]|uniref:DUF6441 family protein n=1 Tax=Sphingobium sp. AS12 TaxID=2849495 RepID=UPI001C313575|nr:DUF6441 family protein [Sphingobium sp. AS12]MBV2148616.1 hypothetical protein [Sphingobium sp. AS12]